MSTPSSARVFLVGNPNSGKTTLFNALTGDRQKTGNYSGVTVTKKTGHFRTPHGVKIELTDLPGALSLTPNSPDEEVTRKALLGELDGEALPDLILCVLDSTNLERHLYILEQCLELGLPAVAVLNKIDAAESQGIRIDPGRLAEDLGCAVIPAAALSGKGITRIKQALRMPLPAGREVAGPPVVDDSDEAQKERNERIREVLSHSVRRPDARTLALTDKIDRVLLHPILGGSIFLATMFCIFWVLFSIAGIPMDFIDETFANLATWVSGLMPEGDLNSLISDGIIAGVGSVVIFLPQIVLLFLFIALLESTGYMARAAFLVDRFMSIFGLSGKAFLPMLSGYACAIPGVMATRTIPDAKERLATLLVLPWTSCSARLPVYLILIPLFISSSLHQTLVLFGIYALGTITALVVALIIRRSSGPRQPSAFMLELPPYQLPDWRDIAGIVVSRALAFLKKAGTIILGISILLWFLNTYPKSESEDPREQQASSFMGLAGKAIEPVVAPLGWDDRLGTAMLTSFAAREVFVSSLAISYSVDEEQDEEGNLLRCELESATRDDGAKLYTLPVILSLIVFYIYALQCLPTTAVVRRETGSWKTALGQLGAMTAFAYLAAFFTFQLTSLLS